MEEHWQTHKALKIHKYMHSSISLPLSPTQRKITSYSNPILNSPPLPLHRLHPHFPFLFPFSSRLSSSFLVQKLVKKQSTSPNESGLSYPSRLVFGCTRTKKKIYFWGFVFLWLGLLNLGLGGCELGGGLGLSCFVIMIVGVNRKERWRSKRSLWTHMLFGRVEK